MNVLSLFEEFLPNWAKQNNQPIPTKNTDRWYLAWHDFVKTELNSKWLQISQEYKNMQFKTSHDLRQELLQKQLEKQTEQIAEKEVPNTEPVLSDWEKVQQLRKNKN